MTDILSSKELDDKQKARLYNQVLQRYLTYYDQRKGQPLHVKISTPKTVETPKSEENEQPTEEPVPEKSISSAVEQEGMKSVPKFTKPGQDNCRIKLKSIKMSCIGMIKESCCMKPNPFQVLIWWT